jgi:hypothetical protein
LSDRPSLTLLANPGHGNGPTVGLLLAAEACARVSGASVDLVFPDLAALDRGRQRTVIRNRRDGRLPLRIFFDRTLGNLLAQVTLQRNDFAANVVVLAERQPAVQAAALAYLAGGLRGLTELQAGGTEVTSQVEFAPDDITFELSHGSRLRFLHTPRAYAFFPCLLSDLLRNIVSEGRLCNGGRDFNRPATVALRHAEALEAGYRRIFLPAVHTFSWDAGWRAAPNVEFTPFPRPAPLTSDIDLPGCATLRLARNLEGLAPGIYLMPSGVGSAGDASIVQAATELLDQAAEPLAVYMPPAECPPEALVAAFAAAFPHALPLPAQHIAHPSIRCVTGRAGWGTLWECLNAGQVFVAIPALPGDDPEIAHNLRTLAATGLALTWEPGTASSLWRAAGDVQPRIRRTLAAFEAQYGTMDGLKAMARTILTDLGNGLPG